MVTNLETQKVFAEKTNYAWQYITELVLQFESVFEECDSEIVQEQTRQNILDLQNIVAFHYKDTDDIIADSCAFGVDFKLNPFKLICKCAHDIFYRFVTQTAEQLTRFYCRRHRVKICAFCLESCTDTPLVVISGKDETNTNENHLIKLKLGCNGLINAALEFSNVLVMLSDLFKKQGMNGTIANTSIELLLALKKQAFIEGA
jgi:hypothetical protein